MWDTSHLHKLWLWVKINHRNEPSITVLHTTKAHIASETHLHHWKRDIDLISNHLQPPWFGMVHRQWFEVIWGRREEFIPLFHSIFQSSDLMERISGHGPNFRSLAVAFANNSIVSESSKVGYPCLLTINQKNWSKCKGREMLCLELPYWLEIP